MSACWGLAITEGTIENVSCPSPQCVKQRTSRDPQSGETQDELSADLVESVVGKEARERWQELKDKRMAEIGKTFVYLDSLRDAADLCAKDPAFTLCPRPTCQAAVPPPEKTGDERWDSYRICPKCQFSFCINCASTWHGPHTVCPLSATDAILSEYLRYPPGSAERLRIEKQRGKANIDKLIAKWQEDEANKAWILSQTSACTGCGVRVEKRSVLAPRSGAVGPSILDLFADQCL